VLTVGAAALCLTLLAVVFVPRHATITVMTRNLYLGGDITRPVRAAQGLSGREALIALGHANRELRDIVDRTDFRTRSRLVAQEIRAARPDVVGLQEVALWRHGPLQLDQLGVPNATQVDYDFLPILLGDLSARGVGYDVVVVQEEADVEAPAFSGDPLGGTPGSAEDVRLTDRDVLLVRHDSGVHVSASGGGHYQHQLAVELSGVPFTFVRGFAWADVAVGAVRLRLVTTHLESQSADVTVAQAGELATGAAAAGPRPAVIVCDCNSDPAGSVVRTGQSAAPDAAYRLLTGAGYQDQWLRQRAPGPGSTSGLSEGVRDPVATGFTRRLDLVLARAGRFGTIESSRGDVSGDELSDRDPGTGLWPSDHAGVFLQLRFH
jgi:endonuclease/exonuclease/phosphatase family metal-dependent hydrolase